MNYIIKKYSTSEYTDMIEIRLFDLPHHIIENFSTNDYNKNYSHNDYKYIKIFIHYDNNNYNFSRVCLYTDSLIGIIENLNKQDLIQILYFNDIYLEID